MIQSVPLVSSTYLYTTYLVRNVSYTSSIPATLCNNNKKNNQPFCYDMGGRGTVGIRGGGKGEEKRRKRVKPILRNSKSLIRTAPYLPTVLGVLFVEIKKTKRTIS